MSRIVSGVTVVLTALALPAAAGALAGWLGRGDPRLDALTHLALAYGVIGALGLAWALLAGRGPLIALSLLALAGAGLLVQPEFARDDGPGAGPDAPGAIKVIQLNALRDNADIGRVARWLTSERPDVITVTEARHDLRDLLVRQGWATAGARGSLMIFTRTHYAVMDRPALRKGVLNFVNATYAFGGRPAELVTAHLDWPIRAPAVAQRAELVQATRNLPRERMILTGDFNATPWSGAIQSLDSRLGLIRRDRALPTWPAQVLGVTWPLPFLPIDHVYAGPGWATVSVRRGPWVGSDHYPVVVILAPVAPR